jgi:hypothetical protein
MFVLVPATEREASTLTLTLFRRLRTTAKQKERQNVIADHLSKERAAADPAESRAYARAAEAMKRRYSMQATIAPGWGMSCALDVYRVITTEPMHTLALGVWKRLIEFISSQPYADTVQRLLEDMPRCGGTSH